MRRAVSQFPVRKFKNKMFTGWANPHPKAVKIGQGAAVADETRKKNIQQLFLSSLLKEHVAGAWMFTWPTSFLQSPAGFHPFQPIRTTSLCCGSQHKIILHHNPRVGRKRGVSVSAKLKNGVLQFLSLPTPSHHPVFLTSRPSVSS